jgi:hypothetical protein
MSPPKIVTSGSSQLTWEEQTQKIIKKIGKVKSSLKVVIKTLTLCHFLKTDSFSFHSCSN